MREGHMSAILCFVLGALHRLESAIIYSRWSSLDNCHLLTLVTKWKHADGGYSVPVASVEEALAYVKRDAY